MATKDRSMTDRESKKTLDDIWAINKAVADRLEELIHLQRVALLGPDRIMSFLHEDEVIRMALPLVERDYIQRNILKLGTFYEQRQLSLLRAQNIVKPGAIICDVGANIGNHSVYFAKTFRPEKLVSIEPQTQALNILKRNLDLNGLGDTRVVNCLLGSTEGRGNLVTYIPNNLGGTAFQPGSSGTVAMRTLDDVLDEATGGPVDFVKIDVEGMHVEVLSGARKTLDVARPTIWIELRVAKNEYDSGTQLLAAHGYRETFKLGPNDFIFRPAA